MKRKIKKFETIYNHARLWALGRLAGGRLVDQKKYDTKRLEFQSLAYITFKLETQWVFSAPFDQSVVAVYQNYIKEKQDSKQSLKNLCYSYFLQKEAIYLAKNAD